VSWGPLHPGEQAFLASSSAMVLVQRGDYQRTFFVGRTRKNTRMLLLPSAMMNSAFSAELVLYKV
jgi:hypothetical protein